MEKQLVRTPIYKPKEIFASRLWIQQLIIFINMLFFLGLKHLGWVIGKPHPVSKLLNTIWNSFMVLFLFLRGTYFHTLEFRKNASKFWPDQTSPASLPFFACYELMLFGCLCIGMSFFFWGPEVKGMHQSLAPQPTMNNQLICDFHLLSYLGI